MISFPSSLNKSGNTINTLQKNLIDLDKYNSYEDSSNASRLSKKIDNTRSFENINSENPKLTDYSDYHNQINLELPGTIKFENPLNIDHNYIENINLYGNPLSLPIKNILESVTYANGLNPHKIIKLRVTYSIVAPSMFNPINTVNINGITKNVPLLNMNENNRNHISGIIHGPSGTMPINNNTTYEDTSDCTIKTLVDLSNPIETIGSKLGRARYKFADFMYCEDLGKIPNNQMITLRRFPYPVNDYIFKGTDIGIKGDDVNISENAMGVPFDIARMITWFGTEDNKLEDILHYSYSASWRKYEGKIDRLLSNESANNSPLGKLAMLFGKDYFKNYAKGLEQPNNSLNSILGTVTSIDSFEVGGSYYNSRYREFKYGATMDENRVYTPLNTTLDNSIYEGKLEFKQNIKLVFKYKLRAYNNINPKSAFLDLLANILVCTYRKGLYWGGERSVIGVQLNRNVYATANSFINSTLDNLGGVLGALTSKDDSQTISDKLSKVASQFKISTKNLYNNFTSGALSLLQENDGLGGLFKNILGGAIKNSIGRPELYVFSTLLGDGPVGFWHLTIGNPRNPIAVMGNLKLTNATVTHSGPLGIDDFPTELKVEVELEPCRSRDRIEIERMYTQGISSIYLDVADTIKSDIKSKDDTEFDYNNTGISALYGKNNLKSIFGTSDLKLILRVIEEMK